MAKRSAVVVAVMVEVQCPWCGEPQPSPDNGSHAWMPLQVRALESQTRHCVSCDEPFTVHAQSRVGVSE